jgi:N-acetylglucosaminyldiphosphoundecaprenol N-acetyl-beta-D-mannosaminyltransferase
MMVRVLNIPLHDRGPAAAVAQIVDICEGDSPRLNRCVSATSAHGLVHAMREPAFGDLLRGFYCNVPDGMPGVWLGKLKGAAAMARCRGPDLFRDVLVATRAGSTRHYLCGGVEGVAEKLRAACARNLDNRNVVGTHCPPFRDLTDDECRALADDVNAKGTDILWIGISTPKQEHLARRLSAHTNVHFLITVGAAFDVHIGKTREAPRFMQRMGLEWAFRLCMDPGRLGRRYLQVVPLFLLYGSRDLVQHVLDRGTSQ